jgi:4-amino-4-deoxy-L-arabinose transferase-like glycosyltransferase
MTMPPSRSCLPEWPLIGLLTLLGAIVRLWSFGRLGLTHFDEGMYAMAALWITQPKGLAGIDPAAVMYAPPGFVTLVGLGYLLFGFADLVPILVSILAGIVAIPLAAAVARQAFGAGAGVAAAALAALSGPHVAFSRMALTDALFLDTWLLAMLAGARFLARPGIGRAIGLGLAVGLAQNVKYNGGLAGIIVAIAAGVGLLVERGPTRAIRLLGLLVLAGLIAGLMYLPWAVFIERHVGYAKLAAHHRGYAGGLLDWPAHLNTQLAQVVALSGGPSAWHSSGKPSLWALAAGWLAAVLGSWCADRSPCVDRDFQAVTGVALFGAGMFLVGCPTLPWWLGLAWTPGLLRDARLVRRLLGVWWLTLSLITPWYHPYARLWLPLVALGWIMAGGLVPTLWKSWIARGEAPSRHLNAKALLGLGIFLLALYQQERARILPGLLAPTDSFRRHLTDLRPDPRRGEFELLLLLARPHATFYVFQSGAVPSIKKMRGLDQLLAEDQPGAWALVDEVMLRQEGDLETARRRLFEKYEPVRGWTETLPPATLLDVSPRAAFGDTTARASPWMLMRPKLVP